MLYQKDSSRGWVVVGAAFVGMLFSVGVLVVYSFGVLSSAIMTDFGWGDIQRSTIFVAFSFASTFAGVVWGAIADRVGSRRVVLVSCVLLAICFCVLAALPADPLLAVLVFAALGLFGAGTLPPPYASVVVGWFDRHRGLALGVAMLGVGLGTAILPVVAATITTEFSWRVTCLVYAALVMFVALPVLAALFRPYPEAQATNKTVARAPRAPLSSVLKQARTWILISFAFLSGGALLACVTNFVPLLQSRGETLVSAAQYQAVLGISLILGRVITGALVDRLFAPRVMTGILLVTAAGVGFLQIGDTGLAYVLAAMGIGLAIGAEVDFLGFMVSRYYDRASFTTIFALMFAAYSLGASIGPLVFGWLLERSGSYDLGLTVCALGFLVVSATMFFLPRYASHSTASREAAPALH